MRLDWRRRQFSHVSMMSIFDTERTRRRYRRKKVIDTQNNARPRYNLTQSFRFENVISKTTTFFFSLGSRFRC